MLRRGSVLLYRLLRPQSIDGVTFHLREITLFLPTSLRSCPQFVENQRKDLFFPGESCIFACAIRHFRRVHL